MLPVACGGGGGAAEIVIEPQNATATAAQGLAAVELLTETTDLASSFLEAFEGGSFPIPCEDGNGSLVLNDVAPQGALSSGDSATLVFQACSFGGLTMNGRVTLEARTVIGAPPGPFTLELAVTFSSLTMTAPGAFISVDGGLLLHSSSPDGVLLTNAVSGTRLSAFVQESGRSRSVTLTDFRLVRDYDELSGAFAGTLDGVVSSSELGGRVRYATPVAFTGTEPNDPSSGSFVVTGAQGSTMTVLVLNEVDVQLLVDADGDGTPDVTIHTTWDDLRS